MIALAFLKALPWRKILPILAAVAVIVGIWWQVDNHFEHVADLEDGILKKNAMIEVLQDANFRMIEEQTKANTATKAAEDARDAMDQAYQDLVANPPAEVVRWRERIVTIPAEITGPTCEAALIQGHQVVIDTAGWPGGAP